MTLCVSVCVCAYAKLYAWLHRKVKHAKHVDVQYSAHSISFASTFTSSSSWSSHSIVLAALVIQESSSSLLTYNSQWASTRRNTNGPHVHWAAMAPYNWIYIRRLPCKSAATAPCGYARPPWTLTTACGSAKWRPVILPHRTRSPVNRCDWLYVVSVNPAAEINVAQRGVWLMFGLHPRNATGSASNSIYLRTKKL